MSRAVYVLLLALLLPAHAYAQCPPPLVPPDAAPPCLERYPSWTGELAILGGNALLSGVSAGVVHKLRGGSFSDAFTRGVVGGVVIYGGKRIAVERFGGAGLLGRQVNAVGASMVRNASDGRGLVELIDLPVGPLWLQLQSTRPQARLRLDVVSTGWLISGITNPDLRFDAGMSLSSGSHVFIADDRVIAGGRDQHPDSEQRHAHGITEPGFMALSGVAAFGRVTARRVFQHERVHVLQMDQLHISLTRPAEQWAMAQAPGLGRLSRYVDINLSGFLLGILSGVVDEHLTRPWETEAIFLSR